MTYDITPDRDLQRRNHIEETLQTIRDVLQKLHYGSISLTVHDERVVQLDITEKKRLTS